MSNKVSLVKEYVDESWNDPKYLEYMQWLENRHLVECLVTKDVGPAHDLTRLECDLAPGHTGKHRGWFDRDLPIEFEARVPSYCV